MYSIYMLNTRIIYMGMRFNLDLFFKEILQVIIHLLQLLKVLPIFI
jgi:hypothetical protein